MKFIQNLVMIDLKNEDGDILLANGINGLVDVVHRKERAEKARFSKVCPYLSLQFSLSVLL